MRLFAGSQTNALPVILRWKAAAAIDECAAPAGHVSARHEFRRGKTPVRFVGRTTGSTF